MKKRRSQPVDQQVAPSSKFESINEQPKATDEASQRWKEGRQRRGGGRGQKTTTNPMTNNGQKTGAGGTSEDLSRRPRAPEMSHLQRELIGRRKNGVSRREARQTLLHQLIWRENESTNIFHEKRWCILVASNETNGFTPKQIWCQAFENDVVVSRMVLLVKKEGSGNGSGSSDTESSSDTPSNEMKNTERNEKTVETQTVCWLPENIVDLNAICSAIHKFCGNCWNNLILVPAMQFSRFIDFFHWLKDSRDLHYRRDTQSVRLDRLMCIEDVIQVFRDYNNHEGMGVESLEWERITTSTSSPIKARHFIHAACNYTRNALRIACMPPIIQTQPTARMSQHFADFANPFMRSLPTEPESVFGLDDDRSPEKRAESQKLVQNWLSERCSEDAEYEDMEPFHPHIDVIAQPLQIFLRNRIPYFPSP